MGLKMSETKTYVEQVIGRAALLQADIEELTAWTISTNLESEIRRLQAIDAAIRFLSKQIKALNAEGGS